MGTYLIKVSKLDSELVSEFLVNNFGINILQFNPDVLVVNNFDNIKDIITLSDVKDVTSFVVTRPIKQSKKYIVFVGFEGAAVEVQNRFLKLFEDSPAYLDILLIVKDSSTILDTVKSRCRVLYVSKDIFSDDKAENNKSHKLLEGFSLDLVESVPNDMLQFLLHFKKDMQDAFKQRQISGAKYNTLNRVLINVQRYLKLNLNHRDIWRWFVFKVNEVVQS